MPHPHEREVAKPDVDPYSEAGILSQDPERMTKLRGKAAHAMARGRKFEEKPISRISVLPGRNLALRCGGSHYRRDLAEDGADAGCDARHDGASGDSHESSHEGIFNQVLASLIAPGFDNHNDGLSQVHLFSSLNYPCGFSPPAGLGLTR